jgi:hypothetical protein
MPVPLKKIDVFMDLESIGVGEGIRRSRWKIDFIASTLPPALRGEKCRIASVTCFASYMRPTWAVYPGVQNALRDVLRRHGWTMVWSRGIADVALIDDVTRRLANNTLSEAVMIVTNDHDFVSLVAKLRESGREVFVSGPQASKKFANIAHKVTSFWEYLGGHPEKVLDETVFASACQKTMPNPIPL